PPVTVCRTWRDELLGGVYRLCREVPRLAGADVLTQRAGRTALRTRHRRERAHRRPALACADARGLRLHAARVRSAVCPDAARASGVDLHLARHALVRSEGANPRAHIGYG